MRLTCPNCDAEYEVDDTAIPMAGRDVQCSNCGHGWFQMHPEAIAEAEAEEDLYDAPPPPAAVAAALARPDATLAATAMEPDTMAPDAPVAAALAAPEMAISGLLAQPDLDGDGDDDGEGVAPVPDADGAAAVAAPARGLDESVLAVLREEAERETNARRGEAGQSIETQPLETQPLETQTEMGLSQAGTSAGAGGIAAAVRRIARLKGEPEPVAAPMPPKSRRDMLPAIEDINSTLRATSELRSGDDSAVLDTLNEAPAAAKSGFRRGFTLLVALAVVIVALYIAAPMIAAKVPALAGVAAGYVRVIDAARLWLDTEMKSLVAMLRGLQTTEG